MLLNNDITLVRVSSVLNKDVKQYGKNHMFDGEEDTCWNSDHGTPQWINLFVNPQDLSMIKICVQFQGGFCGKNCFAEFYEDNTVVANFPFYPEDVNAVQFFIFEFPSVKKVCAVKLIFPESTDFFGRIIVYNLSIHSA